MTAPPEDQGLPTCTAPNKSTQPVRQSLPGNGCIMQRELSHTSNQTTPARINGCMYVDVTCQSNGHTRSSTDNPQRAHHDSVRCHTTATGTLNHQASTVPHGMMSHTFKWSHSFKPLMSCLHIMVGAGTEAHTISIAFLFPCTPPSAAAPLHETYLQTCHRCDM
jgi:hypothetical protein